MKQENKMGKNMNITGLVKDYLMCIYNPGLGYGDAERIDIHDTLADYFGLTKYETYIITDNLPVDLDFFDDTAERYAFSLIMNGFKAISDMKKEGKTFKNIDQVKRYLAGEGRKVFEKEDA